MKYRNFFPKNNVQEILSISEGLKLNKNLDANCLHTEQCVITLVAGMQTCILE